MKTCGIDLDSNNAYFAVLSKEKGGVIRDLTGSFTKLGLSNDENCKDIRSFCDTVKKHLDIIDPVRIGIVKRNKRGKYAGGVVTFKMEGLIQLYDKKNVVLVSPHSLRSFENKKKINIKPKYKYQKKACLLAAYLLEPK